MTQLKYNLSKTNPQSTEGVQVRNCDMGIFNSLTRPTQILYFLYMNKDRTFTIRELAKELEDILSFYSIKVYVRNLKQGLMLEPHSRRHCSVNMRVSETYNVSELPKSVRLLFNARGIK